MEQPHSMLSQPIDFTRQTDVNFWCRMFHLTAEQLREAVRHAGHQPSEIFRYLESRPAQPLG
jgi:hypothetical protein